MAKVYKVTVKSDYRWNDCQVAGRVFSKKAVTEIGEAAMNEEILKSELLDIQVSEAESPAIIEPPKESLDDTVQPRKRGRQPAQSED